MKNQKLLIEEVREKSIQQSNATVQELFNSIEDNEIKKILEEKTKPLFLNRVKSWFSNPLEQEETAKKRKFNDLASKSQNQEVNFNKLSNHYSILDTQAFKEIFNSFDKRGDDLFIHLNSGNAIKVNQSSISLQDSSIDKTKESNMQLEVKTMINLAFENNMKNIKVSGEKDYVKVCFEEIKKMNEILPESERIAVIPRNKIQEKIFKEVFAPAPEIKKEEEAKSDVNEKLKIEEVKPASSKSRVKK